MQRLQTRVQVILLIFGMSVASTGSVVAIDVHEGTENSQSALRMHLDRCSFKRSRSGDQHRCRSKTRFFKNLFPLVDIVNCYISYITASWSTLGENH